MSAPRWTESELKRYEQKTADFELQDKLARKGIILHDQKPGNKYRNKIVEAHGKKFDSKKEAARYNELLMMERGGLIEKLGCQKKFPLNVNDQLICIYISDFDYLYLPHSKYIVEDVKSNFTRKLPVYSIKRKLMKAIYNIEILEV